MIFLATNKLKRMDTPDLTEEKALIKKDVIDLFLLSFESPKMKNLIQSMKWDRKKAGIFLRQDNGNLEITVLSKCGFDSKLVFTCGPLPHRSMKKAPKVELDINGDKLKLRIFQKFDNRTDVYLHKKYEPAMYSALIQYICDLFNERVFGSVLHKMNRNLNITKVSHMLVGSGRNVKSYDLDTFLRGISIEHVLVIAGKVTGDLPVDSPVYDVDCLFMTHGQKMKQVDLLNFRGEHAFFSEKKFTFLDVTTFLDRWIYGNHWNLETMIVYSEKPILVNHIRLIERYTAHAWIPAQRARHYPYNKYMRSVLYNRDYNEIFDCADGYEIERKSDGLLATFKFSSNHFFFFVWHDRFPRPEMYFHY
ncbi:unnamed protein product [Caenorhabditis brenneri]